MKQYFIAIFIALAMFCSTNFALAAESNCCKSCVCAKGSCCKDGKCTCKGDCCKDGTCKCAAGKCGEKCTCKTK